MGKESAPELSEREKQKQMERFDGCVTVLGIGFFLAAGLFLGSMTTYEIVNDNWQVLCVERGHAEWKVDQFGHSEFTWKEAEKPSP